MAYHFKMFTTFHFKEASLQSLHQIAQAFGYNMHSQIHYTIKRIITLVTRLVFA